MSRTRRDKDKWKIRMLNKRRAEAVGWPMSVREYMLLQHTPAFREASQQIEDIQMKYGGGLRVRAGRKGSTRHTLAVLRRVQRRRKKRGERQRDFTARIGMLLDGE